ncbi:hypothetical protein B0T26DRAFT_732587 [Lasiosphaeria miniovina]|uniref:Uncharacterized protein n=1 Tax=Lasiosphaeria miniovina TaxID=1954250 RepID=A0AA39ZUE6_9PEZI|nr:uncharacterized protein B0T26DRAFT_732587 [Lasiosphaeria miniovina]KAK0703763.1 hypothetical protein B0T26DRAFT_732587 [Lasiosphaeria miniovina]
MERFGFWSSASRNLRDLTQRFVQLEAVAKQKAARKPQNRVGRTELNTPAYYGMLVTGGASPRAEPRPAIVDLFCPRRQGIGCLRLSGSLPGSPAICFRLQCAAHRFVPVFCAQPFVFFLSLFISLTSAWFPNGKPSIKSWTPLAVQLGYRAPEIESVRPCDSRVTLCVRPSAAFVCATTFHLHRRQRANEAFERRGGHQTLVPSCPLLSYLQGKAHVGQRSPLKRSCWESYFVRLSRLAAWRFTHVLEKAASDHEVVGQSLGSVNGICQRRRQSFFFSFF